MDALTQQIVELASRLIERSSVSPDDAGCQTILKDTLESQGFQVTSLPFEDVDNFWATHGEGSPVVMLAGHTDVVPAGPLDDWRHPPFEPTIEDGMLYGRGSADMKGSLAAMALATQTYLELHPEHPGTIAYLITSDEEAAAVNGTTRVIDWLDNQQLRPEYCVVGEPSSSNRLGDTIRIGRRGSLNGRLQVNGVQGHVAYPDQARNPIHETLAALLELTRIEWDEGNAAFPPTSLQISNTQAGTGANNVIPGSLSADFNLRFSTEQTAELLMDRIEALFASHELDYEIAWSLSGEPFLTATDTLIDAVTQSVHDVQGIQPITSTGGGTSDGRFIARLGTEIVELGPVNATIHSIDECTDIDELKRLSAIYLGILQRLLATDA